MMIAEMSLMLAAILPGFVMARIEGRPFGDFGLPARTAFGRNFWVGTLWGIASLSVLILALRLAGAFEFGSLAIHGASLVKFALFYGAFFLLTGFFEEFLLRGYSQWVLSKGMHFWPAAALLSLSFGAIHGANPDLLLPGSSAFSSASRSAAPAISGGPSASTCPGIGAKATCTRSPTAERSCPDTC
jgi:membrane protease YdiL (CAAX protease family)